jgi:hypothetical protein
MLMNILTEAGAVGVLTILIGVVLHMVSLHVYGPHDLNDMKMFAVHLFMIGVLAHLICEYTGINKWYCKNGFACKA